MGTGALGKDVQDQQRAIDHAPAQDLFHRLLGVGRQLVVDDDQVGVVLDGQVVRLGQFPAPEVRAWISVVQALRQTPDDFCASGARQLLQFVERLGDRPGCIACIGGKQQRALRPGASESILAVRRAAVEGHLFKL